LTVAFDSGYQLSLVTKAQRRDWSPSDEDFWPPGKTFPESRLRHLHAAATSDSTDHKPDLENGRSVEPMTFDLRLNNVLPTPVILRSSFHLPRMSLLLCTSKGMGKFAISQTYANFFQERTGEIRSSMTFIPTFFQIATQITKKTRIVWNERALNRWSYHFFYRRLNSFFKMSSAASVESSCSWAVWGLGGSFPFWSVRSSATTSSASSSSCFFLNS